MTEKTGKYEDDLYGKIEFLHENSIQNHNRLNIISEIITKFINSIQDFSKSIENIKNRKAKIIDNKESSLYQLIHFFKLNLKAHKEEFKECASHLNLKIIGPLIRTIDEKYLKEKELYNNYIKVKNVYINSKAILEKSRKEFENNAKLCESNILNLVKSKSYDINSAMDITKIEERTKLSIMNAKNFEDKYIQCLEEANNARENEINNQKELLKYYQILNTEFYSKINCLITFTVPMIKKMYSSILKSLEALEDKCKNVKIQKDLEIFVEKNKSDIKPDKKIQFIPYYPEANLDISNYTGNDKKDLENLDINYKVILTLHENFRDIRKDIDMEEEKKKFRLRFLCSKIFKIGPGIDFKKEEKEELVSFFKKKDFIEYFLVTLSKQRTKGRFRRSETLVNDLSEILNIILNESEKDKDYEGAKNCIILSQTFYFEIIKEKKKKKKYLFEYIRNNKWLNTLEFWEGLIEYMIQCEIKKNQEIVQENNYSENEEEIKAKISNIALGQILSYSTNMIEFQINKDDIIKIVDLFIKKYEIEKSMAEIIYENINNSNNSLIDKEEEIEDNINKINKRPKALTMHKKQEEIKLNKRSKSLKIKDTNNTSIINNKENLNDQDEDKKIIENNQNCKIEELKENNKNKDEKKENNQNMEEINKIDEKSKIIESIQKKEKEKLLDEIQNEENGKIEKKEIKINKKEESK